MVGASRGGLSPLPGPCSTCCTAQRESLEVLARRCDVGVPQARSDRVAALRQAAASGMTRSQIAREIGRSQPEVSRLLRFHGTTPLARQVRRSSRRVRRLIAEAGGADGRVFGSVATGTDGPDSVDLVPESALRPDLRERVSAEAVPCPPSSAPAEFDWPNATEEGTAAARGQVATETLLRPDRRRHLGGDVTLRRWPVTAWRSVGWAAECAADQARRAAP